MATSLTPKARLLLALAAYNAPLAVGCHGSARWQGVLLFGALMTGLAWLYRRSRRPDAAVRRLRVQAQVSLSSKANATLLEVDGEQYLALWGDAFAVLCRTPPARPDAADRTDPVPAQFQSIVRQLHRFSGDQLLGYLRSARTDAEG